MTTARLFRSKRLPALFSIIMALALFPPSSILASGRQSTTSNWQMHKPASLAQPLQKEDFVPGEVLVKVKSADALRVDGGKLALMPLEMAQVFSCFQLSSITEVLPGTYKLSVAPGSGLDVQAAISALNATGDLSYAQPNYMLHAMLAPNDDQYVKGQQWSITQIHSEEAWDITTGSPNVVIAILDTGTSVNHPDLHDKIVPGYDFANGDSDPNDDEGHGSMTSGIAAASSNNGEGITGVSWGSRIMPVKVLNSRGSGSVDAIAMGIHWAVDNGARIINASLGSEIDSPVLRDAANYAHDHNVLLVAASGNSPDGKPNYPAAYNPVLAVGATGRSDTHTGFSSFGPYVDVTAPGVGILSSALDNTYAYGNGTSFSSPLVAGVAALVLSINPSLTADQVKQIIEDSSDDFGTPGFDENYGWGRVNAFRAVQMAQKGPPIPHTPTPAAQPTRTPAPAQPTATNPPAQNTPSLQLDSKEVSPGALVAITGAGFGPNELIDLKLATSDDKTKGIGSAQTGAQGTFRAEVALPADVARGKATLSATGAKSGATASIDLNVSSRAPAGQSIVRGTVSGVNASTVTVRLKPSIGISGPELTAQPKPTGEYVFLNLASGIYSLSASAGATSVGPFTVQIDGSASDVKVLDITISSARPKAFDKIASVPSSSSLAYFPQVGHSLKGPFLKFWQANGGLPIFGYPLSEEYPEVSPTDGKMYTVQYFERNRFELHPEFAGTRNEVLMGLLGVETTRYRTFAPGTAFQSNATKVFFNETKHSLQGPFLKYWQKYGGLPIFGYPISEEIIENSYTVQYFERNRFEYHPEYAGTPNEVLLGLLGVEVARRNGWIAP